MTSKLDLEKAYDRLNWKFFDKSPTDLDFSEEGINWIMECITSTGLSVLVNGIPSEPFKIERGIRQEILCLLVLFLFVLSIWVDIFFLWKMFQNWI